MTQDNNFRQNYFEVRRQMQRRSHQNQFNEKNIPTVTMHKNERKNHTRNSKRLKKSQNQQKRTIRKTFRKNYRNAIQKTTKTAHKT